MPAKCCVETLNKMLKPEHADEPVFLLRAQDELAKGTVERWIELAKLGEVNADKIRRAKEHLLAIMKWQLANPERVKVPD